jgi:UDP-N-acetyl-D-galactosamine dehydrogenase
MFSLSNTKIAVIGLGYVGLPLAVEFGRRFPVIGFDIKKERIGELSAGTDVTLEVSGDEIASSKHISFSSDDRDLADANVYIVTVPTPIDEHKQPDLRPLIKASEMIAPLLRRGDVVIYESTVYPGVTEDECAPILQALSGLVLNSDFFVGYSPERINPGDKTHTLSTITKVVSGSTSEVLDYIASLYSQIISAGVFKATTIRVAEAAKVIENTQRDVNIALVNELSIIFNRLGIDTAEVLEAAETKWNFLPFRPGLVGGHCIGVDPYYLTHKAQAVGYHPEMILAGRRLNDNMSKYVVSQLIKYMVKKQISVYDANVLILGLTFKENCPDLRNTKVIEVVRELAEYNIRPDIVDPWCSAHTAKSQYNLTLNSELKSDHYDAILLAVPHKEFVEMGLDSIRALGRRNCVLYDLKGVLAKDGVDLRL